MNIAPVLFDAFMPMASFVLAVFFSVAGFKLYESTFTGWFGERKTRGILAIGLKNTRLSLWRVL